MKKKNNKLHAILGIGLFLTNLGLFGTGLGNIAYGQSSDQYYTLNEDAALQQKGVERVVTLKTILEEIEQSHNISFFYDDRLVENKLVAVPELESDSLANFLGELLSQKGLIYKKQTNRTYVIMKKSALSADMVMQQELISGNVADAQSGETLPGVNILVKGTSTGASTDQNGNFELEVPSLQDTLVVTYIGYQRQEVPINGRTEIDIQLTPEAIMGEEMVVVGYGTQRKADLTGAISSVTTEDLDQAHASTITQALQGRVAGAQVTTNSAAPGAEMSIRIRGTGSLSATSEPLYVVDGVPISGGENNDPTGGFGRRIRPNPLSFLNPEDIESIDVLKDASSTAIYGARGTNGVVLITTKKARPGQSRIEFESSIGVQSIPEYLPSTSAQEWAEFANESARFQNLQEPFPDPTALGEGPDWEELVFRNAATQKHNLSVMGGSEATRFSVSAGVTDQQGVVKETKFGRYSVRTNVSHEATSWLSVGANLNITRVISSLGQSTTSVEQGPNTNVINAVFGIPRVIPVYNEEGEFYNSEEDCSEALREAGQCSRYGTPLSMIEGGYDDAVSNRILGNVSLDATLTEGLTLRVNGAANILNSTRDEYFSSITEIGRDVNGLAQSGTIERSYYLAEAIFNYQQEFGELHNLDVTMGATVEKEEEFRRLMENSHFPNDITHVFNIGAGTREGGPSITSGFQEWTLLSYLGRINYNLADKYLFTLTGRADGSSKFGADNKWGLFPSGAIAWRISQEPFFSNINWVSDLKLRASYGYTGNQEIGTYRSLARLNNTAYPRGNDVLVSGYYPGSVANSQLKWEKSKQIDLGFDASFVDNRFNLSFDIYRKTTDDLLMDVPLPVESGFSSALVNIGSIQNQGVELSFGVDILRKTEFSWNTNINIGANRSKVLELGGTDEIFGAEVGGGAFNGLRAPVGEPLGVFIGYVTDGIFGTQAEVDAHVNAADSLLQPGAVPGQVRFVDYNGDGVIDSDDRTVIGNPEPEFTFGLTNSISWKRFSLYTYLQGTYGNEIYNGNLATFSGSASGRNKYRPAWVDRWTPENTDAEWPAFFREPGTGWTGPGGGSHNYRFVENGSYLRVKTVTLGYDLTNEIQQFAGIRSAHISLSADNLLTWSSYRGLNPDVNSAGQSNINRGVDYAAYPLPKVYRVVIQLGL